MDPASIWDHYRAEEEYIANLSPSPSSNLDNVWVFEEDGLSSVWVAIDDIISWLSQPAIPGCSGTQSDVFPITQVVSAAEDTDISPEDNSSSVTRYILKDI